MKKVPGASHGAPYLPWAFRQCLNLQMVSPPLPVYLMLVSIIYTSILSDHC
ncbi:unnamed protein product [Staurois parvus]|uniref:Uncharacterized protein n=1 Tax=Staurois parvus TaxID=386267 RepID=A0ABN9D5E3_9NEOB|nr:unnamed protein product [Staurois parvus]